MRRDLSPARPQSPDLARLQRLLGRMDRRLAKAGLTRKRGETLARFASRVEAGDPAAAAWYADYAAARYGVRLDAAVVTSLDDRLKALGPVPKRHREPANAS